MPQQSQTLNSLRPLQDQAEDSAGHKHDTLANSGDVYFDSDGHLIMQGDHMPTGDGAITRSLGTMRLCLEDTALTQLGGRLGPHFWQASKRTIPADFYRQLHRSMPAHFASFTNDLLDHHEGKLLIRGYDDKARAILSDSYESLDNLEMLDMAATVLQSVPYEVVQSGQYYSRNDGLQRDEMAIRIITKYVLPRGEDGGYGLGVMIRNGETGGSASEVRPLVMRTQCMNSLIFKQGENGEQLGTRLTHRGSRTAKLNLLASAIAEAMPMAQDGLERFLTLKTQEIDLNAVIARLGVEQGWGEEMRMTISIGTEGHHSLFGLVNGLSFAAHATDSDQATRIDLESMAAAIVQRPALVRV